MIQIDMEKPNHCLRCPMRGVDDECVLIRGSENFFGWEEQYANCPLREVEPEPHWISCKERMPEKPYGCLATVWDSTLTGEGDDFENLLPYFVGWDGEQWNDEDGQQCPFEVIAWQPLPEKFKEEGGEE